MTEQGEGQPLSAEDRLLRAIFGKSNDAPPAGDALSHSVPADTLRDLAAAPSDVLQYLDDEESRLVNLLEHSFRECLTPREALVLRGRFGLEDGQVKTLKEVGKELEVSRERARQIESEAIEKLRTAGSFIVRFREYLEEPPTKIE